MVVKKALIILTENGSQKLLGLSLLKRLILNAHQAGIEEFWICWPEFRKNHQTVFDLTSDLRILNLEIRFKPLLPGENPGSLTSENNSEYLIIIQDNLVLDPEILPRLVREVEKVSADFLLVETAPEKSKEVVCPGLLVARVSSFLEKWNKLPEKSAAIIGYLIEKSDNLQNLIVPARFALQVCDRVSLRQAEKLLLQTARKPQDGIIARLINRRISLFLTRYLIQIGITPNQWSIVTLLIGLSSVACIAYGQHLLPLGAFLFELASVVDGSDGENARLTYRVSQVGGALDIIGDAVTFVSFFAALPVGLYRTTGNLVWIYLGIFTFASMSSFYTLLIRYSKKTGIGWNIVRVVKEIEAGPQNSEFKSPLDILAARIAFIYRRDFFSTAAFVLIMLELARILMVLVAGLSFLEAVYMASYSSRRLRLSTSQQSRKQH